MSRLFAFTISLFMVTLLASAATCVECHTTKTPPIVTDWKLSKHAAAWVAMKAMPTAHALPASSGAPTCQTCHMQGGDHAVITSWGFLALRLPLPQDKQWAAGQVTILKALGVLHPDGKPTVRLDVVKAVNVARLTAEDWQCQRDTMVKACHQCHSENFAKAELAKGDQMIKEADRLLAEAIEVVAGLYKDGV